MARTQYVRETKIREKRIINDDVDEEEDDAERRSRYSTTIVCLVSFLTHCLYLLTIVKQVQTNFEKFKNDTQV